MPYIKKQLTILKVLVIACSHSTHIYNDTQGEMLLSVLLFCRVGDTQSNIILLPKFTCSEIEDHRYSDFKFRPPSSPNHCPSLK